MNIVHLTEKDGDVFEVLMTPSWLERLFGVKAQIRMYYVDRNRQHVKNLHPVVYDKDGKMLNQYDEVTEAIDQYYAKQRLNIPQWSKQK
jgi:hypothetical protein